MAAREVSVHHRRIFWRVALPVFLVRQVLVLNFVRRFVPRRRRLAVFLFGRGTTRKSLALALFSGATVTLVAGLFARLVVQPLVRSWLTPAVDESAGLFRLSASERVLGTTPARRLVGRRWPAGTLIRTNQRVWFVPAAWDVEPVAVRPEDPARARLEPGALAALGLIRGVPDRLAVWTAGGEKQVFAVADPGEILEWFRPPPDAPRSP